MASVAAVVVVAATVGALVGGFPDLHVYRYAGRSVLDQWPAYRYDDPVTGYPLTYPPFAALLMVPVALLPGWAAAGLWTGLSAGCLAAAVVVTARYRRPRELERHPGDARARRSRPRRRPRRSASARIWTAGR